MTFLQHLLPNEEVLADKRYCGIPKCNTLFKSGLTDEQEKYNKIHAKFQIDIERIFARMKLFKCLSTTWRHDLSMLPIVFKAIVEMVNVDLQERPLNVK